MVSRTSAGPARGVGVLLFLEDDIVAALKGLEVVRSKCLTKTGTAGWDSEYVASILPSCLTR